MEVLVVKIGAVGDTVMALAMLDAVRRIDPGANITWLCGGGVEPLVRELGGVNQIITVDEQNLLRGGLWKGICELFGVWKKLFGRRFDLIANGHTDRRYGLLTWTAFAKVRRSFGSSRGRRLPAPGRYHADEYVRLITGKDGLESDHARIRIQQPSLSVPLRRELGLGKKIVALAPGGAKNILRDDALRRWPLENYVQLAEKLMQKGFRVLITGSDSDDWIRDSFRFLPVVDLVGKTSLVELTALYRRCDLVVTHDSGPLHLAVAAGTRVLALFGPTMPFEKVPRNEKVKVVWGGKTLACRPCYDGKNYALCSDNQCLKSIHAEVVFRAVLELMKSKKLA
jgi:heptosyltransferase II